MDNEGIPEYLYKYTTFDSAMKIIENSTLYWSSADDFNDPFEYRFRPYSDGNEKAITTRFLSACSIMNINLINILKNDSELIKLITKFKSGKVSFNEIERFINNKLIASKFKVTGKKPTSALDIYKNTFLQLIPKIMKQILNDKTGVLCLTDDKDERSSRLMWSHYAENHRGVKLKLNSHYLKNVSNASPSVATRIGKVKYQEEFPLLEYEDYLGFVPRGFQDNSRSLIDKMTFTKSNEWEYENEYRCLATYNGGSRIMNVDKRVINSVYIGLRTDALKKSQLIQCIKNKMPHVKIYETAQENNNYKLYYKPIQ